MNEFKENSNDKKISEMVKYFLKDSISLRNETNFASDLSDLIHPLVYSIDSKKYPNMNLIPVIDKGEIGLKKLFLEILK